ncbi:hypothetical protein T492DRAFT_918573 [Pavlovales sp. CCMP2436]|nr:hypothetical protein T492DRAFT_918573 [Pavlovales sp. CCMP2436]
MLDRAVAATVASTRQAPPTATHSTSVGMLVAAEPLVAGSSARLAFSLKRQQSAEGARRALLPLEAAGEASTQHTAAAQPLSARPPSGRAPRDMLALGRARRDSEPAHAAVGASRPPRGSAPRAEDAREVAESEGALLEVALGACDDAESGLAQANIGFMRMSERTRVLVTRLDAHAAGGSALRDALRDVEATLLGEMRGSFYGRQDGDDSDVLAPETRADRVEALSERSVAVQRDADALSDRMNRAHERSERLAAEVASALAGSAEAQRQLPAVAEFDAEEEASGVVARALARPAGKGALASCLVFVTPTRKQPSAGALGAAEARPGPQPQLHRSSVAGFTAALVGAGPLRAGSGGALRRPGLGSATASSSGVLSTAERLERALAEA